jgi:hypothetical protein
LNKNINTPRGRRGNKLYNQGFYNVINKDKYMGDLTKVRYLSSWELKFFMYADSNPVIKRWSSESIIIPYQDGKGGWHRYISDVYIEKVNSRDQDILDRYVIEIKPYNDIYPKFVNENGSILPPERYIKKITPTSLESYEYQLKMYQKNLYKWTKAKNWCEKNGYVFMIIHEKYMKEKGIL